MRKFPLAAATYFVLVSFLAACQDIPGLPTDAAAPASELSASAAPAAQEQAIQQLAKGLAVALANPDLRMQVLHDLRDSPFPQHRLHLRSYLQGPRGAPLVRAASHALGAKPTEFMRVLASLPELELLMPVHLDRARWTGTADVVVTGAPLRQKAHTPDRMLIGYTTSGADVAVPLMNRTPYPILAIYRSSVDFGPDPERVRAGAPKRARPTVSTREEEFSASYEDPCQTDPYICDPNYVPPPPPGLKLPSGRSYAQCTAGGGADGDYDGILDECENEIAYTFRPYLAVSVHDDNLRREPYWAVRKCTNGSTCIEIFYALAYHEDGGSPSGGFYAHQGDSEFIIEQVYYDESGVWVLNWLFLSAHWGTPTDSSEGFYVRSSGIHMPDGDLGRPLIWVAEDKHANYKDSLTCDAGAGWSDNCDHNYYSTTDPALTVEVLASANLGRNGAPLANQTTSRYGNPGIEYFWDPSVRFRGWLTPNGDQGAGPYYDALWAFGF